ncbi:MAG: fatty acid kinase fatty acid binding subunit [Pseudothermotoga sp.]|nr:fatty acid kinase fatty acid binding subunit [Pseudothermotoga sp.]
MKAVVFDSSIDVPVGYEFKVPVFMLPLNVYVDGKEYRDKVNITEEEFYS